MLGASSVLIRKRGKLHLLADYFRGRCGAGRSIRPVCEVTLRRVSGQAEGRELTDLGPRARFGSTNRSPLAFLALDFETANRSFESACAVALVLVEDGLIVCRKARRIRPSSSFFQFSHIHGMCWEDVRDAPGFADVWSELAPLAKGASFIAAHNARFDRRVLRACCRQACLPLPCIPFLCTVGIARRAWNLRCASLPLVCHHLGIPLRHHDPLSDAEACARIVIAAGGSGPVRGGINR